MKNGTRYGDPRKYIHTEGNIAYITLTKGAVAIIDATDADKVGRFLWHLGSEGYAMGRPGQSKPKVALHRFLLDPEPGVLIDHVNLNKLDNRRANLRTCTSAGNQYNKAPKTEIMGRPLTSQYKGVRVVNGDKFCAQIRFKSKAIHLGRFTNEEAAARAYDCAALRLFGEFAKTNF